MGLNVNWEACAVFLYSISNSGFSLKGVDSGSVSSQYATVASTRHKVYLGQDTLAKKG